MIRSPLLAFAAAIAIAVSAFAADPEEGPVRKEPAGDPGPLVAKLIAKKTEYVLAQEYTTPEFLELTKAKRGLRVKLPEPPAVDLVLEITNSGAEPIAFMVGSDAGRIDLNLSGPGAVSLPGQLLFTKEFRLGKPVEIAGGGKYEVAITSLKYGMRGVAMHAYWTQPGNYKLSATFIAPRAGKGQRETRLTVTTPEIDLTVKAP